VGAVANDIDMRVAQFEDLLGSRIEAVAGRIESIGRQASEGLMTRAEELSLGIKSHVEDAERSLTNLVVNTSETIQTGARAAQQSLLSVSSDVGAQLKLTSAEVERTLTAVGSGAADSIVSSARDAQSMLVTASGEAANQVKLLSGRGRTNAFPPPAPQPPRRSSLARAKCKPRWSPLLPDAANHVKTLAADVEQNAPRPPVRRPPHQFSPARVRSRPRSSPRRRMRPIRSSRSRPISNGSLSIAGTSTAQSIVAGAREAQSTLVVASAEAANHVKSLVADVEQTLSAAGTATAASILSGAREVQTSLVTASGMLPTTSSHWRPISNGRCPSQGLPPPESVVAGAREAQSRSHRIVDTANHVKSLAVDIERTLRTVGADTAASVLNSAREAQSSLMRRPPMPQARSRRSQRSSSGRSAQSQQALRTIFQSSALNAQSALMPRLERSQFAGQVDLRGSRTRGSRRQRCFQFHHDRQDRRNRHLRATADRSSVADDRWQARIAGRGDQRQDQSTHGRIDRVTSDALKSIENRDRPSRNPC
jgi:hypothetical protein